MNPQRLLVAVPVLSGLFITVNSLAQTWTQTSAPSNAWRAIAISADGTKVATAADDNGGDGLIYTSGDSGGTWLATGAPAGRWDSVTASADGTKLVVSGNGIVLTSSDFGTNWLPRTNLSFRSLASSADGTRLVGGGNGTWISSDSGVTWVMAYFGADCVASSADGTRLAMGTFAYNGFPLGGIFISTNAGLDWTRTSAPLDFWTGWTALASSADGRKLFATIGYTSFPTGPGPIYVSPDGGDTWLASGSPMAHWVSIAGSADGSTLVAAGDGGLFTSRDSAATWTTNWPPPLPTISVACSADGSKLFAAVNGGGIWISQSTPTPLLNITRSSSNGVLSWTVPSMNFVLQENSELTPTNWTDLPTTPTLNLTTLRNEVPVPVSTSNHFYRLKH